MLWDAFWFQHVSMPLRKEESWPAMKKRRHANSSMEGKDGLGSAKSEDNPSENTADGSENEANESEQNKKV